MWIEELPNGKFKAVERYDDYLTGKSKKVSVTMEKNTVQSRKLAQAALAEKIRKKQQLTTPVKKDTCTLSDLVEEYRKDQLRTVETSTYRRNYHACNTLLRILGKETLVDRFSAKYIRDGLLATGEEPGTLNGYLERLHALLRWGYQNDMIRDISYLSKVEKFKDKPHKEKIQDKFMEGEEAVLVMNAMTKTKWKDFTQFLVLSGLRIGEALALTSADVDLKNRLIRVHSNYDTVNHTVSDTPKNTPSIRDVYIQDELLSLCKKLKRESLSYRLVTGKDIFFQDEEGRYKYYSYNKYLKDKTKEVLGHTLTPHSLRHTHASLLMEQGISIDIISRRLGHENSKITREIYLHVTEKLKEKDNQKLAAIKLL